MRGWRKQVSVLYMSDGLSETKHYCITVVNFKLSWPPFELQITSSNEKLQHFDFTKTTRTKIFSGHLS